MAHPERHCHPRFHSHCNPPHCNPPWQLHADLRAQFNSDRPKPRRLRLR